jgi:serine/threonine protein kinase
MPDRAATDESFPSRLPLPLAQLYRRADNAKSAVERYIAAYYLWEAALKLLASVAIVEYAERGPATPECAERLKNLARPTVGHWWELVRLLVPMLADTGDADFARLRDRLLGKPTSDCPRAAGLDALLREVLENKAGARTTVKFMELFTRLVSLRNAELGHGAAGQRPAPYYERTAPALLAGVAEALQHLDVLAGRCLVHVADVRKLASGEWLVERLNLSGGEVHRLESLTVAEADTARLPRPGRLYLHGPDALSWRTLHPLVLFDADAEMIFFLNARVRQKRAEYLCYTSGQVVKRDELGQDQRELLAKVLGGPVEGATVNDWAERSSAAEAPAPPAALPGPRTIGEFELISRLGRGGMGVVYRAWQPSLCRQVALKCLLRSGDPKSEARFAREIRALGRVDHPHLVKVFTSDSDGDQWFYAMELIEGTDLAAVCAQLASTTAADVSEDDWTTAISTAREHLREQETPLAAETSPQSAERATEVSGLHAALRAAPSGKTHIECVVDVVRQAADAAHALHEANVIHRDIKPGNILLTAEGQHAVLMDLGLAQLADETEGRLTRTRQFVGTLRYASPEQQVGAALDRRTDVYSLGATLWELLTLRPLFGITDQTPTPDMILKLQQAEPERVRKHNPRVPRDLEAIVRKCLAKEKERRYATAAELAADLGRWQRGEPVQAQPPSLGYLLRKKLKKHRLPATVAAVMVLVAVIGLVAYFIEIDAALQREKKAKGDAQTALSEKEKAYEKLKAKEDELAGETARSWLLPLAMKRGPLSDQEIDVLSSVAARRGEPVSIRFVEEGVKEQRFTRRLEARAEYALHAAVGLDLKKRAEVEALLVARMQGTGIAADGRREVALVVAALGDLSPSAATVVAPIRNHTMTQSKDPYVIKFLAVVFSSAATRMEPKEAGESAAILTEAIIKTTDLHALLALAEALSVVAARMEPKSAADMLTRAMSNRDDTDALLAESLSAVVARMEPKEAAVALTQAVAKTTDYVADKLTQKLAAVAARMGPNEVTAMLIQEITKTKNSSSTNALMQGLSIGAARMETKEVDDTAVMLTQALVTLTQDRTKEMPEFPSLDPLAMDVLAKGLSAVAVRMPPKEAAATAATLAQAMASTTSSDALYALAKGLSAVAARMESKDTGATAATLSQAMINTDDAEALYALAEALSAVAVRMEPDEGARLTASAAAKLIQVMITRDATLKLTKAKFGSDHPNTLTSMNNLAFILSRLAHGWLAVATRMQPSEAQRWAAKIAGIVSQAMTNAKNNPLSLAKSAETLSAVAGRMEPKEAARVLADASDTLTEAVTNTKDMDKLNRLAKALLAVVVPMQPKQAAPVLAKAATTVIQGMTTTGASEEGNGWQLAHILTELATRIEPKEAVDLLTDAMTKVHGTNSSYLYVLAEGLSAVAARMEPEEARVTLTKAITKELARLENAQQLGKQLLPDRALLPFDYSALAALARGLSAVSARMELKEARVVADTLIHAISNTSQLSLSALSELAEGVSAIARRMEPEQSARLVAASAVSLCQAMARKSDTLADNLGLLRLAPIISQVAAQMEPNEAAAALFTQAITKATNPRALDALTAGLSKLAERMDHKQAAKAAATLAEAMAKTNTPQVLPALAKGVSVAAARMEPKEGARLTTHAAALLTQAMAKQTDKAIDQYLRFESITGMRDDNMSALAKGLMALLCDVAPDKRPMAVVAAIGGLCGGQSAPSAFLFLRPTEVPPTCPLTDQDLVELLKDWLCVDLARRAVLDELGRRHRHRFADQWDFVHFATEQNFGLDFTSPPKRR